MGFNKGIYGITGCSIMLQMAEKKTPSSTGWFLLTKKRPNNVSYQQRHIRLFTDHNALVKLVFLYFH